MKRTLTPDEVDRAIVIDFEGRTEEPPVLLGVLEPDGDFTQYVIDDAFATAAAAKAKGTDDAFHCVFATPSGAVDAVHRLQARQGGPVVGFSRREYDAIIEIAPYRGPWLDEHYRDGKETAKRWARRCRPDHEFVKRPGRGRYTLDQFLGLIGYDVPPIHGPGHTGERIRYIREMIGPERPYEDMSRQAKADWSNLLKHNNHDCHGLLALLQQAAHELAATP